MTDQHCEHGVIRGGWCGECVAPPTSDTQGREPLVSDHHDHPKSGPVGTTPDAVAEALEWTDAEPGFGNHGRRGMYCAYCFEYEPGPHKPICDLQRIQVLATEVRRLRAELSRSSTTPPAEPHKSCCRECGSEIGWEHAAWCPIAKRSTAVRPNVQPSDCTGNGASPAASPEAPTDDGSER